MASSTFQISMEEFNLFHKIDRNFFTMLVVNLQRDPFQSIHILALWIWLEQICCSNNFISKILSLPLFLINELADEGATCLKCIWDNQFDLPTLATDFPLTQHVTKKEFSLHFFYQYRDTAINGIRKIVTEVCYKAFLDIIEKPMNRAYGQTMTERNMSTVPPSSELSLIERMSQLGLESNISPIRITGHDVPSEERAMFVTFSRGYPVAESEIREFFALHFGINIESIVMQEVKPNKQALHAQIVFDTPGIIELILNDKSKAKFNINGKHVWMQKYISKD